LHCLSIFNATMSSLVRDGLHNSPQAGIVMR